jgi:hypothetical protein
MTITITITIPYHTIHSNRRKKKIDTFEHVRNLEHMEETSPIPSQEIHVFFFLVFTINMHIIYIRTIVYKIILGFITYKIHYTLFQSTMLLSSVIKCGLLENPPFSSIIFPAINTIYCSSCIFQPATFDFPVRKWYPLNYYF